MLEQDRYQHSPKLYIIGMVMLMLFWLFLLIGLYIVPYLIWGFHYEIPEFIIALIVFIQEEFDLSLYLAKWLTFLTFMVPAGVCMVISCVISYYIDHTLVVEKEMASRTSMAIGEAPSKKPVTARPVGRELSFATTLFILMMVGLVILFLIEWLISSPPPAN